MVTQIPWNEELETLLLHCVIVKGAHICGGKQVTQSWEAVNDMFFDQHQLKDYQEAKTLNRKLRDKFNSLIGTVQNDIDTGNQSGKDGDLSKLYEHANTIIDEIATKEALRAAGPLLKAQLNEAEKEILSCSGPLKRKRLNGEIIDNTRSDRPPPMSLDDRLFFFATGGAPKKAQAAEDQFEVDFLKWIEGCGKTTIDLLRDARVDLDHHHELEDIGLDTLTSMYCTRNADYSAQVFKDELRGMGIPLKECSKLYMGLQKWRRLCLAAQQPLHSPANDDADDTSVSSVSSMGMASTSSSSRY